MLPRNPSLPVFAASVLALVCAASLVLGFSEGALVPLVNPDPLQTMRFGAHIADFGGDILVGTDNVEGFTMPGFGAVFLLEGTPGEDFGRVLARFQNPSSANRNGFGAVAEGAGDIVVAGASHEPGAGGELEVGAIFLFDADPASPSFQELLLRIDHPEPAAFDRFGSDVAILPGFVFASAAYKAVGEGQAVGVVYAFDADPASPNFGALVRRIDNPEPVEFSVFGEDGLVAYGGNTLAVGALGDNSPNSSGKVYIFDATPGPTFGALLRSVGHPNPEGRLFGFPLATMGTRLLTASDTTGADAAVYAIEGDRLSPDFARIVLTIPSPSAEPIAFGDALGSAGSAIVVGAPIVAIEGAEQAGAAYLYDGDPASPAYGQLREVLLNPSPGFFDKFGDRVGGVGDVPLIGAPDENDGLVNGIVYAAIPSPVLNVAFNGLLASGSSALEFTVNVPGRGPVSARVGVGGSVGGTLTVQGGRFCTVHITRVALDFDDASWESGDDSAEISGARVLMDDENGTVGAPYDSPDGSGLFVQPGNELQGEGVLTYTYFGETEIVDLALERPLPMDFDGRFRIVGANGGAAPGRGPVSPALLFEVDAPMNESFPGVNLGQGNMNPSLAVSGELEAVSMEFDPPSQAEIVDYLIGIGVDPLGLDVNEDGAIDVGDVLATLPAAP